MAALNAQALLENSAFRGELTLSIARAIFVTATWVRFVALGGLATDAAWVSTPPSAFAVIFSLVMIWRVRSGRARVRDLYLSVVLDAAVCFLSLLPNVLWPQEAFAGILRSPDVAAVYLMVIASLFRLFASVVLLSGFAGAVSLSALSVFGGANLNRFTLALILVVTATFIAAAVGRRTKALVLSAATNAVRAEEARGAVHLLLEEHHDTRSVLSSALMNAQLLRREAQGAGRARAERIASDLEDVTERLRESLERGVETRFEVSSVALARAAERAVAVARSRFVDVRYHVDIDDGARWPVVGGAEILERVLVTLLVNAAEGDGTRGAANVRVHLEGRELLVDDDGPGFREVRTKTTGTGLGLTLVRGLLRLSGTELSTSSSPEGGARVSIARAV